MGIAFGILALGGTEPEIYLGGHLPPPQLLRTFKNNTIATLGLIHAKRLPCIIQEAQKSSTLIAQLISTRSASMPGIRLCWSTRVEVEV